MILASPTTALAVINGTRVELVREHVGAPWTPKPSPGASS